MLNPEQYSLRCKVSLLYDMQRLRIQADGRTNVPDSPAVLDNPDKDFLISLGKRLGEIEKDVEKSVTKVVEQHPFWEAFLNGVKGIGPKSAGVILSSVDIHKANTPSALWLYAGVGVVPHVRCSVCGHESWNNKGLCQKVKTAGKNGKPSKLCGGVTFPIGDEKGIQRPIKGEKVGFNKFLKTKLLGVVAPNFLKLNSPYRKYYDDYKNRIESAGWGKSKGHRHNAAMRYMIKMFLLDLWKAWRTLENLPVREAYAVEYLGKHKH